MPFLTKLCLLFLASALSYGQGTHHPPERMLLVADSYEYFDSTTPATVVPGVVPPIALTARGPNGNQVYLKADANGNLYVICSGCSNANNITWPYSSYIVVSNGTNNPTGLAPVNGECVVGLGGVWSVGLCSGSQLYPLPGIMVSAGSSYGSSLVAPSGTIVGTTDTQTLTNKTITGPGPSGSESVAFSVTPTFSIATRYSTITMTNAITSFALAAGQPGQEKILTFCGPYTVLPPTNVRGFMIVYNSVTGKCSSQQLNYDSVQSAWFSSGPGTTNE